jgi:hypothetical protein
MLRRKDGKVRTDACAAMYEASDLKAKIADLEKQNAALRRCVERARRARHDDIATMARLLERAVNDSRFIHGGPFDAFE